MLHALLGKARQVWDAETGNFGAQLLKNPPATLHGGLVYYRWLLSLFNRPLWANCYIVGNPRIVQRSPSVWSNNIVPTLVGNAGENSRKSSEPESRKPGAQSPNLHPMCFLHQAAIASSAAGAIGPSIASVSRFFVGLNAWLTPGTITN